MRLQAEVDEFLAGARRWQTLGLDDQLKEISRISARKAKNSNVETREWWSAWGPEALRPLWLLNLNRDRISKADEISQFADAHLTGTVRDKMKGAMFETMFVSAAARLLPAAEPFLERIGPILNQIWEALDRRDTESALLDLSELSSLNARAYQMLNDVLQPPGSGRPPGSGYDDQKFVDEYLSRLARGERPQQLKHDIAARMPGAGLASKEKRLERAVRAHRDSLPSSPVKRRR